MKMNKLCGLIPAAGRGTRAYPYTKKIPKCMLEINGVPNLKRNILLMREQLNISDIFIVIGDYGQIIKDYFKDGSQFNVNITYIQNDFINKGLAYSILLGKEYINNSFVVILSDECYVDSNHSELIHRSSENALATISVMEVDNYELIKQNYSVEICKDRITKLTEKPQKTVNNLLGCGTFIFNPKIFDYLDQAFNDSHGNNVDLITLIDKLCHDGEVVNYFELKCKYVNINDKDSLQLARYYVCDKLMKNIVVSLIIYSAGNEEDITFTINQYKKSEIINNIYVLIPERNSVEQRISACNVKIIKCPSCLTLYGEMLKYGLKEVTGDIFIITEANYSFPYHDISKLFVYLKEADMVIGTRTTRQLIKLRSNMKGIVRLANIFLAKLIEVLWWDVECRFTDVGCTFRAIWRSTFQKINENLVTRGPEFSVEMKLEILRARDRIIEVPVNYYGRSYSQYEKYQNANTFFRMLYIICRKSILRIFKDK